MTTDTTAEPARGFDTRDDTIYLTSRSMASLRPGWNVVCDAFVLTTRRIAVRGDARTHDDGRRL